MGLFKKILGGINTVSKVAGIIPGVGSIASMVDLAIPDDIAQGNGGSAPPRPFGASPKMMGMGMQQASLAGRVGGLQPFQGGSPTIQPGQNRGGILPRGPGGRLQLGGDPKVADALKPFALDDRFLKTYFRAPKGYVVVYDSKGNPFPLLRKIAIDAGLWRPGKKPPISVGDWQAFKSAERVEKRLQTIARKAGMVKKTTSRRRAPAPRRRPPAIVNIDND